ncbi:MAG: hypothetical protein NT166_21750 [Candidatus Aminicenantes bacterium]|nr:hypothetical protein [Candidatus Aminicenantes bacterium]
MIDRPTVNINELIEILSIPEIEDIIWKKLESLKTDEPAKFIRLYKEKKKTLRQEIFENKRKEAEETDKARHDDLRWFEIVLFNAEAHWWKLTAMEPVPMTYYDKTEILPVEVIKAVEESPVDRGKVRKITNLRSDLVGKSFDLTFIHYSCNNAFGTIRENPGAREMRHQEQDYTLNENMDMAYNVFFTYMKRYPEIRDYFFNEFFNIIKPMHDRTGHVQVENCQ